MQTTHLVTGITGKVGQRVARGLLARGHDVRGLSRTPRDLPPGIRGFQGDLTRPDTLPAALEGVNSVFLYAQGAHIDEVTRELKAAGVERVVVLSTIDATNASPSAAYNRRRHLEVEDAIADSGLRFAALRPGAFMSNARRFWQSQLEAGRVALPWPESQQAPIDEEDIAAVAVAALEGRIDGQRPVLTGPEGLTQAQQVQLISRGLERHVDVLQCSPQEARAALAKIVPPAYVELLLAQWEEEAHQAPVVTDEVRRITGRAANTYANYVAREWRHA